MHLHRIPKKGIWKGNTDNANQHGGCQQRQACPALDEGDFIRPNNVDDEGLRKQGFHEPSSLKKTHRCNGIGAQYEPQKSEGCIIKHGADGTDANHEFGDVANLPTIRLTEKLLINRIAWNGRLRTIV